MRPRPPGSTCTDTLFPDTTLFRSNAVACDGRVVAPAGRLQAEPDVVAGLGLAERRDVMNGDDALAQLLEALGGELAAKLRLADQEDLQQRAALVIDVRQHAKLFQGRDRNALRLVDDEDGPHIAAMHVEQEPFQHAENRRLIGFFLAPAEGRRSEENTSELQSLMLISNAVFC